jgi:peptidoglycan LD-endopeptidase LytH
VQAAVKLRARGWTAEATYELYQPFIVTGRAAWIDTWGAPRFGPGSLVRQHEGQDVFCEYGAPVLAVEEGVVEFDTGLLGGRVAKLHRPGGGFWYYAHLSDWPEDMVSGSKVALGDVIGFCGNTGNAIHSAPHVHFGWYGSDGDAIDPMATLVRWLEAAERRALARVAELATVAPDVPPEPPSVPVPMPTEVPFPLPALERSDVFGAERERPAVPSGTPEAAGLCTLAWLTAIVVWRRGSSGRVPKEDRGRRGTRQVHRGRPTVALMPWYPAASILFLTGAVCRDRSRLHRGAATSLPS